MPIPVTAQLPPPESWEEFESMCADLYSRIWNDPDTQKHGRQGQPQGGVDVYGRPNGQDYAGVQCKKRDIWPPKELTSAEVDEEVEKAKIWKPDITQYIIATTASNDEKVQAHARNLTTAHQAAGLFSVSVVSWGELARRLTSYPELAKKYYPNIAIAEIAQELVDTIPVLTAKLVAEQIRGLSAALSISDKSADVAGSAIHEPSVVQALERDLATRYSRAVRRSFFPEAVQVDEFESLADFASDPQYVNLDSDLRRRVLLRASRGAAVRGFVDKAEAFLLAAQALNGRDPDVFARARIAEQRGDIDGALALLRDETSEDARSITLSILFKQRGREIALKWFSDENLSPLDLTINGLQILTTAYAQGQDFESIRKILGELTVVQLDEGPYFRFLRGVVTLSMVLPIPDRSLAIRGLPLDMTRVGHSILDEADTIATLDEALADLNTFTPIADELGLRHAKRLAEAYLRWCELLHPNQKQLGLERLRAEMRDVTTARGRLPLAFAFDREHFDPKPLERYLARREELGGLDDDDLQASLVLRLHGDDPGAVATLIARHRSRFEAGYRDPPIGFIEVQALALAGEASSARLLFEKCRDQFTGEGIVVLETLIAKAEGGDPVIEDLRAYEANKTVDSLRALVRSLAQKRDHRATAKYSEELYARTLDPSDIARTAQAFVFSGDGPELIRVMEAYSFLLEREPGLTRRYAWELFRSGRLQDAGAIAARLSRFVPTARDQELEIAIAIESGDWELLAKPLASYLDEVSRHSGLTLIRAAAVAQASNQGPMMDLVKAAVSKADDDPLVWLGAYTTVIEEGLEDEVPEHHDWFMRALALSGSDGPVQRFELKELVPQQAEWNQRTLDISDRITRAEMPLVIAAPGLRTTVVDIVLRNLVRNFSLEDARRKYVIPLFSGHRNPERCGTSVATLGLDISSLLVLGWLGLLRKVFDSFTRIALPARILVELFEGRRRVQQVQKSRIKRARELERAISRSGLKIARPAERPHDASASEIGQPLAALIRLAAEVGGVVLRPAPIHRPGLDFEVANVNEQLPYLTDMHTLLSVLVDRGAVDQMQEGVARSYFGLQDTGLPGCVRPDPDRPLIVDGLALVYLQYTDLLNIVLKVFKDVRIEGDAEDEALTTIDHNQHVEAVLTVIDDIRNAIRTANASGKIVYGPRRPDVEGGDDEPPSTLHLLSDLARIDALVCDDRFLNKENFAADNKGNRLPCISSLDLLDELRARDALADAEWRAARHKLRVGGAGLVPVQADEIIHAAQRSRGARSAELRAIQESIDLARAADMPTFPREMQWFIRTTLAIKPALMQIWLSEKDRDRARKLSNLIISIVPRPEDWVERWETGAPPQWVASTAQVLAASLATPVDLENDQDIEAYHEWLEAHELDGLRTLAPERYRSVVEYIGSFVASVAEEANAKKKGS